MSETLDVVRLSGLRLDSLGNYLAALGLMEACSQKWADFRGLWFESEFVVGSAGLTSQSLRGYLASEWRPTSYERWWKGSKEIAKLRSWEPSLARVRLLDAHIVAKGTNVYNDILGTGGNVGKRDFAKVSEVCRELITKPDSGAWLSYSLFGTSTDGKSPMELPDLPSTGTWFANANKAFNSGYSAACEGQLSPWSFLLALEGAILLRGGSGKRLSARATRYATFPFVSEAAAPATVGEMESERSEFWAPIWDKPAKILELKALLQRGQARVGKRAARAPFDFAAAALTSQVQAGLVGFERFGLRQTTSANTYEAINMGRAAVRKESKSLTAATIQIADWAESLPRDKSSAQQSVFCGMRAPVERALTRLAQKRDESERWRDLLMTIAQTQRHVDRNQNWRSSTRAISKMPAALFDKAWPEATGHEVEIARAIASLGPSEYGLRHNIFGLNRVKKAHREMFADPRPASFVWHDGDPIRLLADVLERRLLDAESKEAHAPAPPLRGRQFCSQAALDSFARGEIDVEAMSLLLPALSLIHWSRAESGMTMNAQRPASPEFLLQGYFRPLLMARLIRLKEGSQIVPDATRARALVKMIRGEMWQAGLRVSRAGLSQLRDRRGEASRRYYRARRPDRGVFPDPSRTGGYQNDIPALDDSNHKGEQMTASEILKSKKHCLTLKAELEPVGGTKRFQPAGFPEIGHVIYKSPNDDGTTEDVCIIDSAASMANHLETVCLAGGESVELHEELTGLPYVVCVTKEGESERVVCTTFTEGHRLASDYFLKGTLGEKNFRDVLREKMQLKELTKDKKYFFYPDSWPAIYETVFRHDPNSLVHGLLFAREEIKISRVLTAHHEGHGAKRVPSSGVKFDRLGKTLSGQPIFSVDEETAKEIVATFTIDLGLIRSYGRGNAGLPEKSKLLLLELALWKVIELTEQPFRFRSGCHLKLKGDVLWDLDDEIIEGSRVDLKSRIAECADQFADSPTKVFFPASELYRVESPKEKKGD